MAIRMSISFLLFGISTSRSLETGEKQVNTLFRVAGKSLIVVRPSMVPVITAVLSPYLSFMYMLHGHIDTLPYLRMQMNMSTFLLFQVDGMRNLFIQQAAEALAASCHAPA